MPFTLNDLNNIESVTPFILIIFKWVIIIIMVGYTLFSALVLRQVKLMLNTVKVGFETPIQLVAAGQLLFGIAILLFTLFL